MAPSTPSPWIEPVIIEKAPMKSATRSEPRTRMAIRGRILRTAPMQSATTATQSAPPRLNESPIFQRMKDEGTTSKRPLSESFAEWGNAKLGKYQRVTRVEYRESFPRATHDKVLKRALRDPYWVGRERSI